MGGIYEVRPWDGVRYHDIHTKFQAFKRWEGGYIGTQHGCRISFFYIFFVKIRKVGQKYVSSFPLSVTWTYKLRDFVSSQVPDQRRRPKLTDWGCDSVLLGRCCHTSKFGDRWVRNNGGMMFSRGENRKNLGEGKFDVMLSTTNFTWSHLEWSRRFCDEKPV
jgi:hypothetical protein